MISSIYILSHRGAFQCISHRYNPLYISHNYNPIYILSDRGAVQAPAAEEHQHVQHHKQHQQFKLSAKFEQQQCRRHRPGQEQGGGHPHLHLCPLDLFHWQVTCQHRSTKGQASTSYRASSQPDFIRTYFIWERILTFRDKNYRSLIFHDKKCYIYTFCDK